MKKLFLVFAVGVLVLGCTKKEEPKPAEQTAPSPAKLLPKPIMVSAPAPKRSLASNPRTFDLLAALGRKVPFSNAELPWKRLPKDVFEKAELTGTIRQIDGRTATGPNGQSISYTNVSLMRVYVQFPTKKGQQLVPFALRDFAPRTLDIAFLEGETDRSWQPGLRVTYPLRNVAFTIPQSSDEFRSFGKNAEETENAPRGLASHHGPAFCGCPLVNDSLAAGTCCSSCAPDPTGACRCYTNACQ